MENQSSFEGWAIVELFGHQREVGFVTTQAFGQAVLFRIDTPSLEEREYELRRPEYVGSEWCPAGSKVKRQAVPAHSRLVGPGAVYAINPCDEAAARKAIESLERRPLILLSMPEGKLLESAKLPGEEQERTCEECGNTPEEGHEDGCAYANIQDEEEL